MANRKPLTEEQKQTARARARAWNAAHPDICKARQKVYATTNREKLSRIALERYHADPEQARTRQRAWHEARPWYAIWQAMKQRCNNPEDTSYHYYGEIGIKALLSKDDVAFLWKRDKASNMHRPSIDRLDSSKDYTLDNCRFIELRENCARLHDRQRRMRIEALNSVDVLRLLGLE